MSKPTQTRCTLLHGSRVRVPCGRLSVIVLTAVLAIVAATACAAQAGIAPGRAGLPGSGGYSATLAATTNRPSLVDTSEQTQFAMVLTPSYGSPGAGWSSWPHGGNAPSNTSMTTGQQLAIVDEIPTRLSHSAQRAMNTYGGSSPGWPSRASGGGIASMTSTTAATVDEISTPIGRDQNAPAIAHHVAGNAERSDGYAGAGIWDQVGTLPAACGLLLIFMLLAMPHIRGRGRRWPAPTARAALAGRLRARTPSLATCTGYVRPQPLVAGG